MQYKLIALDLDGTLTNSKKEVSPRNKEAIRKAAEKGVKIILASGRPIVGVEPVADVLDLRKIGGYILAYNGGHIVDCSTGESLIRETIPEEYYADICTLKDRFDGFEILTYSHAGVIATSAADRYVNLEAKINRIPVFQPENLLSAIEGPVCKFLAVGEYEKLKEVQTYLKTKYPGKLNVFFSETYFLEIVPPGIEKAASLEKLLRKLGHTREELIACGDGLNDITMISYAGLGAVMENGQDALKERADYITDTNDNDGVAEVIEKFILEYPEYRL